MLALVNTVLDRQLLTNSTIDFEALYLLRVTSHPWAFCCCSIVAPKGIQEDLHHLLALEISNEDALKGLPCIPTPELLKTKLKIEMFFVPQ